MPNRRLEEARQAQLRRAKGDIATRIARVCRDMPAPDFDALVTHMAELELKYMLRRSVDLFPESTDGRDLH
jgi:hypothetical protein